MLSVNHVASDFDLEFSEDFEIRADALTLLQERIRSAPISTQAALSTFRPVADRFQQQVIDCTDRTIRLVAPAGSGKTQTMINRVLTRIKGGVAPDRILLLTFDKSAAGSLKHTLASNVAHIESTVGTQVDVGGVNISTLNAFGYGLLREFQPDQARSVVSARVQHKLIREALDGLQTKSYERYSLLPQSLRYRFYRDFFSYLKNELHDPQNLDDQAFADVVLTSPQSSVFFTGEPDDRDVLNIVQAVHWLYRVYDALLTREQLMDFDDQKLRAYALLRDNHELLQMVQRRYTEVIVDEFQDINRLDFEFIKVVAHEADLVVTGDDDQAIYGFRGCSPDYIIDLPRYLGRAVTSRELSINYRCPPNIVRHADRLIRNNHRRIHKSPQPYQTEESAINIVPTLSASIEAKTIAEYLRRFQTDNPSLSLDQVAILYRTNVQSLPIQIEFILQDIPYQVSEEHNILENDALRKLLGVLRAKLAYQDGRTATPEDQILTLQSYFRSLTPQAISQLTHAAGESDLLDPANQAQLYHILPKAEESQLFDAFESLVRESRLERALEILRRRFKGLGRMVGSLEDVMDQQVPLAEILDIARDFDDDVQGFVDTLDHALRRARQVNAGRQEHGVSLLTYFKSKGRQWHTVILCSCNEGLIPHSKAPVEDERRLFYVALTRASANLLISYVENAIDNKVLPSRFLYEAGLLVKHGA